MHQKKFLSILLTFALVLGLLPWTAVAVQADAPIGYEGNGTMGHPWLVTDDNGDVAWTHSGVYQPKYDSGDAADIGGKLTVRADVTLLMTYEALTAADGIEIADGCTLTIIGVDNVTPMIGANISGAGSVAAQGGSFYIVGTVSATGGMTVNGGRVVTTPGGGVTVSCPITLAGGTFQAESYTNGATVTVAAGYYYTVDGEGDYTGTLTDISALDNKTLAPTSVVLIGDDGYSSLQGAFDAAQSGDTIKLMRDMTVSKNLYLGENVTLDPNGHTLTFSGDSYINPGSNGVLVPSGSGAIKGTSGETVTWSFDSSSGALTFSGTGAMKDYERLVERSWHIFRNSVKTLVINEGITSVGKSAFETCEKLTTVSLPASVALLKESPSDLPTLPFNYCPSLTAINVADGNEKYSSVDGVLYALEDGNPVTLLLCPCGKTGSITVPATVTSFAPYSFYNDSASKHSYTSLSRIEFALREAGKISFGKWDEGKQEYVSSHYVFGIDSLGYDGDCVFVAPEGMRVNDAATRPAKGNYSTLTFHAATTWDALQDAILKADDGTVTLDRDYDYTRDSYQYDDKEYDENDQPITVKRWYGVLDIPAGTVLDLNGHTLSAALLKAAGGLTVKNGTLNSALMGYDDIIGASPSTLTLENATLAATWVPSPEISSVLNWYGAITLKNSVLTVGEALNAWLPPESGAMLTMDGASSLTLSQLDLSVMDDSMAGQKMLLMHIAANTDEDAVAALYQEKLGAYLPEGCVVEAVDVGQGSYLVFVKAADDSYPDSVTLKALTYAVTVNGGEADKSVAAAGETVTVKANGANGKAFDKWTGEGVSFADAGKASTTFTMPAHAVTVTANFKAASSGSGNDRDRDSGSATPVNTNTGANTAGNASNSAADSTVTVPNADGSKTESTATTTEKKNADGSVTKTTVETATTTAADGEKTTVKTETAVTNKETTNADGSVTNTVTTEEKRTETDNSGKATTTEVKDERAETLHENADGTRSGKVETKTTETVKDASGKAEKTVVTEGKGTVTVAKDGAKTSEITNTVTVTDAQGNQTTTKTTETRTELRDGSVGSIVKDEAGNVISRTFTFSEETAKQTQQSGGPLESPLPSLPVNNARDAKSATPTYISAPYGEQSTQVRLQTEQTGANIVAAQTVRDAKGHVVGLKVIARSLIGSVIIPVNGPCEIVIIDNGKTFSDVAEGSWYHDYVAFVTAREIFNGTGDGTFAPDAAMTRGMLAQVLFNFELGANASSEHSFADAAGKWYADAASWATSIGVVSGTDAGFDGDAAVTREQVATMLYRYAKHQGSDVSARADLSKFADADSVSGWAKDAMAWAVSVGIVSGSTDASGSVVLDAQGNATRAQIAAIMERFCEKAAR